MMNFYKELLTICCLLVTTLKDMYASDIIWITFYPSVFCFCFKILFIYLFMAVLGLHFCARAFSSCGKWGPLFIAVRGPLTIAASPVAEHRLQTCTLSNCGSRAQLLRGMWDLPDQGSNPCPLHWQADSQPLRHQGSPILQFLNLFFIFKKFLGGATRHVGS